MPACSVVFYDGAALAAELSCLPLRGCHGLWGSWGPLEVLGFRGLMWLPTLFEASAAKPKGPLQQEPCLPKAPHKLQSQFAGLQGLQAPKQAGTGLPFQKLSQSAQRSMLSEAKSTGCDIKLQGSARILLSRSTSFGLHWMLYIT